MLSECSHINLIHIKKQTYILYIYNIRVNGHRSFPVMLKVTWTLNLKAAASLREMLLHVRLSIMLRSTQSNDKSLVCYDLVNWL